MWHITYALIFLQKIYISDIDIIDIREIPTERPDGIEISSRELQDQDHPLILKYDFTAHGKPVSLRLRRNDNIRPADVDTVYVDDEGNIITKKNKDDDDLKVLFFIDESYSVSKILVYQLVVIS